ncbi:MAG: hypothetical protein NC123_01805 [Butyrivibrio sp.]|nr:hypothetical protein [Acetatifactor muris]MCM1558273.1 hypothetical protein [Butyrivibrio sp.]
MIQITYDVRRSKSYYYRPRKESYELMHPYNDIVFHEMQFPVSSQKPASAAAAVLSGNTDVTVIVAGDAPSSQSRIQHQPIWQRWS